MAIINHCNSPYCIISIIVSPILSSVCPYDILRGGSLAGVNLGTGCRPGRRYKRPPRTRMTEAV